MFGSFSDLAFLGAVTGGGVALDPDAAAYIARVEGASGDNQALEQGVKDAINDFVVGCKADGIWDAIKASCIMAGARTLAGALQPLVGTAPTNFNFVSGDYNRKTGLVGDGSTKELKTGTFGTSFPDNSFSLGVYISTAGSQNRAYFDGGRSTSSASNITGGGGGGAFRNRSGTATLIFSEALGFMGSSRSKSTGYDYRLNGATLFSSTAFAGANADEITVFNFSRPTFAYSDARLAFYSIGEALDLALLDARVTALINAFAAAIP
jgi:hypothetical protein